MSKRPGAFLRDVLCAFAAYVGARWIWGREEGAFRDLPQELLTFAALYVGLQLLVRGWRYARRSKRS